MDVQPNAQERKDVPVAQTVTLDHQGRSANIFRRMLSFYQRFKIEFHISGMVFCLIGGKVRGAAGLLP